MFCAGSTSSVRTVPYRSATALTQIRVDDPDATPEIVLEVEASSRPILLEDLILFKPEGTWVAYDRHTLEEATIPSFIPPMTTGGSREATR